MHPAIENGRRRIARSSCFLPRSIDAEGAELAGFRIVEGVFDNAIDAAAARAALEAGAQLGEILSMAGGHDFNVAVFSVAHPAAQLELAGFAVNEPAETHALNATLNEEMKNHRPRSVWQSGCGRRKPGEGACAEESGAGAPGLQVPAGESSGAGLCSSPMRERRPFDGSAAAAAASFGIPALHWVQMVFVLDNYDSFTYNLVQYLGELGAEVVVRRNDEVTPEEVEAMRPRRILLSPGPCTPQDAGILVPLIRHMAGKAPILGVCLGHQAIGEAFGGEVVRARTLMHGKTSTVEHDGQGVFAGLPTPLTCTRYHSLIVAEESLPGDLAVTARTQEANGSVIMGLRHRTLPVEGVQFHPESVLTEGGHEMIRNFLKM